MNNNQFDNLTREFGNGVSRRDALKLLGAGILSVLFGQYANDATEVLAAKSACPAKGNKVVGTCEQLTACIERGVRYEGKYYDHLAGLTAPHFLATPIPSPTKLSLKDTKNCDPESVCGYPGVCLTLATEPIATFTANPEITFLTWTPKGPVPSGCDAAIQTWQQTIIDHEEQHKTDAFQAAKTISDRWNADKPNYTGCGGNAQDALDALRADINEDMAYQKDYMNAEFDRLSCDFHTSSEGGLKASPCRCDACSTDSELPQACGNICCNPCEVCDNGTCRSTCSNCTSCQRDIYNPDTYTCRAVTCCPGGCTDCNPATQTCESTCPGCATCNIVTGFCEQQVSALQAGECTVCCDATQCETCDPATNTCISTCTACQTCQGGTCVSNCSACETCDSATNTCVSIMCDECMHCENGLCVRTCTDAEVCCGGQCIDPTQYNCCITTNNGSTPCLNGSVCCASGECCDPAFGQCCGGVCVAYSSSHCTNCFPCNADQVCCTSGNGSVYGCCDANQICDPAHGCVAAPL